MIPRVTVLAIEPAEESEAPLEQPSVTLAILEEALEILSISVPWRSSLHFSSSCSLEAPHKEHVWLTVGNGVRQDQQERVSRLSCPPASAHPFPSSLHSLFLQHDGLLHTAVPHTTHTSTFLHVSHSYSSVLASSAAPLVSES